MDFNCHMSVHVTWEMSLLCCLKKLKQLSKCCSVPTQTRLCIAPVRWFSFVVISNPLIPDSVTVPDKMWYCNRNWTFLENLYIYKFSLSLLWLPLKPTVSWHLPGGLWAVLLGRFAGHCHVRPFLLLVSGVCRKPAGVGWGESGPATCRKSAVHK